MEILEIKGNWKSPSILFNPDGNLKIFVQPVSIRTMPSNETPVVSLLGHHGVCCAHSGREVSLKSLSRPFVLLVL